MNKVARGAVSGGTGKELSTKANTTGRVQAGGDGESREGRPSAHPQFVCCLGVGNLRQISPKLEKILGYKVMGQRETSRAAAYWENILKAGQAWNKTPTNMGCAENFALLRNPCDQLKGYLWCKFSFSTPAKQHKINCKTYASPSGQGCEILAKPFTICCLNTLKLHGPVSLSHNTKRWQCSWNHEQISNSSTQLPREWCSTALFLGWRHQGDLALVIFPFLPCGSCSEQVIFVHSAQLVTALIYDVCKLCLLEENRFTFQCF